MKQTRAAALKAIDEFYYTGKPCKHGHVAKRVTVSGACSDCIAQFRTGDWDSRRQFLEELRKKKLSLIS